MTKLFRTIRLRAPGYSELDNDCVLIADQEGPLVWFTASTGGTAFVARRGTVRLIKRKQENNP